MLKLQSSTFNFLYQYSLSLWSWIVWLHYCGSTLTFYPSRNAYVFFFLQHQRCTYKKLILTRNCWLPDFVQGWSIKSWVRITGLSTALKITCDFSSCIWYCKKKLQNRKNIIPCRYRYTFLYLYNEFNNYTTSKVSNTLYVECK